MDEARRDYDIPEDAAAIGAVQDGERAFIFGFKTHRKVFDDPGFLIIPADDEPLRKTAEAACDMLELKPLLNAMTLTPEELLQNLPEEAQTAEYERAAAIVITAARQAVAEYANREDAD